AARKLAEDFNYASTGEAFISGFLHDIGISIMHRYFHSSFVLCADQIENGEDCTAAETSILGMPHEEIGNFLSERWNFPINICDAILNHHKPERAMSNLVLASIVHIADLIKMIDRFLASVQNLKSSLIDTGKYLHYKKN